MTYLVARFQTRDTMVFLYHSSGKNLTKGSESNQTNVEGTITLDILSGQDIATTFLGVILEALDLDFFRCDRDGAYQSGFSGVGTQNPHKIRKFSEICKGIFAIARQLSVQEIEVEAISEAWEIVFAVAPTISVSIFVGLLRLSEFQVVQECRRRGARLDFRKVNVTEGETRQCLVQGSRSVGQSKDDGCLGWNILSEIFQDALSPQQKEARKVGIVVLDTLCETVHPVRYSGQIGC